MIARDGEERCKQHEKNIHLPTKVSLSIPTIQRRREGDRSQDRYEGPRYEVNIVDGKVLERDVTDILQGSPAVRQRVVRSERMSYRKSQ